MKEELSTKERWYLLRNFYTGGEIIPWDRMATPSHEWFDNYITWISKTPVDIPKFRSELSDEEVKYLIFVEECAKEDKILRDNMKNHERD
tara:strand:- start:5089 stop:5358 length:270 start_codon:yes stop_codon:yes gene_type:complete